MPGRARHDGPLLPAAATLASALPAATGRARLVRGVAAGMIAALIWGGQSVVSRQSIPEGFTAADVTVLRFLAAGLVLLPLALWMKPFAIGPLGLTRALVLTALIGPLYSLILIGGAAALIVQDRRRRSRTHLPPPRDTAGDGIGTFGEGGTPRSPEGDDTPPAASS